MHRQERGRRQQEGQMLRMKPFDYTRPTSVESATELLNKQDRQARAIAGGTDLLPNLKLGSTQADLLVSLADLPALRGIRGLSDDEMTTAQPHEVEIGGATTLAEICQDTLLRAVLPQLVQAVERIASPQIRNRATLAGNLCLDTRCRYINQSDLFREALGGCLKSHGDECHVVPGGQNCVAAMSCDTAPILIALGARLALVGGENGARELSLAEFYNTNGLQHTNLQPGELIAAVRVPVPAVGVLVTYRKWARRNSIDFPLVSVGVRLEVLVDGASELSGDDGVVLSGGLVVVGVLGPRPRVIRLRGLVGRKIDEAFATEVGALVVRRCRPLENVPYSAAYRRRRAGVEAARAVRSLVGAVDSGLC